MLINVERKFFDFLFTLFQREDTSYPKLDFSVAELQARFRSQLFMEQANTITIDSVEAIKPVTEHMARTVRGSLSFMRIYTS